jgi:hypothetical protein
VPIVDNAAERITTSKPSYGCVQASGVVGAVVLPAVGVGVAGYQSVPLQSHVNTSECSIGSRAVPSTTTHGRHHLQ